MRSRLALRPLEWLPALALAGLGLAEVVAGAPEPVGPAVLLTLAMTVPLTLRRRWPLAVLGVVVVTVALLVLVYDDFSQATVPLSLGLGIFATGRHRELPTALAGPFLIVLAAAVATAAGDGSVNDVAVGLLMYGGLWAFGVGLRRRAHQAEALSRRARRAEAEQERRAQEAVDSERARIARELHDIVSHSISLIAIQSQAVRLRLGAEARQEAEELATMEHVARDALAEMRRLLGVLRPDGREAPLAPQPGLDQLPALVETARAAGLDVDVRVEGNATLMPAGVDLAAYRIVQESLTNVRRHARARRAAVSIVLENGHVEVLVEDDGRGAAGGEGTGHGLVGMRERVALYGGTLDAGPRDDGGFRVRACLPLRGGVAQ